MTHAFVRPGRSHDFVCHAKCATYALAKEMVRVHGSVECVPIEADSEACREARAELARVVGCVKQS